MEKIMELKVNDYLAIAKADISLQGITVVSGINGCGKSTMSKLLYNIFYDANHFDKFVIARFFREISPYLNIIQQMVNDVSDYHEAIQYRRFFNNLPSMISDINDTTSFMGNLRQVCSHFVEIFSTLSQLQQERYHQILKSTLNGKEEKSVAGYISDIINRVSDRLSYCRKLSQSRDYKVLENAISSSFEHNPSDRVSLSEYNLPVYGKGVKSVPVLHYIHKVAYIDTPMMLGIDSTTSLALPNYWVRLNDELKKKPKRGYKLSINNLIRNRIIHGDASYNGHDLQTTFQFKPTNGDAAFDLMDCATGIKSFSIIQMLLKNQFIDKDTLLILDEPEAHLHPQWIVEYANLIILIHKMIGTHFFIATHSPDFVRAIHDIADKDGYMEDLNFYNAVEDPSQLGKYNFELMEQHDINPIFASFNKSYDKIEDYAS